MSKKQRKRRIWQEPNRLTREAAYFAWKCGLSVEEALRILTQSKAGVSGSACGRRTSRPAAMD